MMQIKKLDHVNLRTTRLKIMIDWYTDVLGMRAGDRPNFPFAGAWMYVGDSAVVHLVEMGDGATGVGDEVDLQLEHFALAATGLAGFEEKLFASGIEYERVDIDEINLCLINLWDPDGNHIHVDFPLDE